MDLLLRAVIGVIVAAIVYFIATAIIHFPHAHLIFGLIAIAIILFALFAPARTPGGGRGGPRA